MKKVVMFFCLVIVLALLGNLAYSKKNVEMEYYCEEGKLTENGCKIVTTVNATYECPEGFEINMETKKCQNVISVAASSDVVCEVGYFLENGKCISEEDYPKNEKGVCSTGTVYKGKCKDIKYRQRAYHCLYGTLNNETNKCDFVDERKPTVTTCPDTYTYNNKTKLCEITTYKEASLREVEK